MLLSGALDPTRSRVVGVTGPESDSQAARCKSVCIRVCTHVRAAISTVRALHGAVGADALVANPTACSEIVCPARVRIRRLHPGDDLRQSLLTIITKYYAMDAAVVLTCVGNLRKCRVKFASSQISSGSVPAALVRSLPNIRTSATLQDAGFTPLVACEAPFNILVSFLGQKQTLSTGQPLSLRWTRPPESSRP